MIGFCPLASGSKGNCLYLGSEKTKILVDAGISLLQMEQRLKQIGVTIDQIDAVLITHEHADHIQGLKTLFSRINIPIICNAQTAKAIYQNTKTFFSFKIFTTMETFSFRDLKFFAVPVPHDTLDPVCFIITYKNNKLGICSDLGYATSLVESHLAGCNYVYLEFNHEESLVHTSARPSLYKQRVLGRQGHLSNLQAANLLKNISHKDLQHVYLAHLSSECNRPDLALAAAKSALGDIPAKLSVAFQDVISDMLVFPK